MKIKKILSIIIITIILLNVSNFSRATILDGTSKIISGWYGDIPYSYNGEETKAVRRSCDGKPIYTIKKSNELSGFYPEEIEIYNNEAIRNILKNGYGSKTEDELNCLNMVEAFLATQEAIYIKLEQRNIDDYVIVNNAEAEIILNATKKILEDADKEKSEIIEVISKDKYWKEYEEDNHFKYKEFTINAVNSTEGKIELQAGENVQIKDNLGNIKSKFIGQDTFYLIVPKNIEQEIKINLSYEKEGMLVYSCKKTEDMDNNFIFTAEGIEKIEKEFKINVTSSSSVEIINEDRETKDPIEGNIFSIIEEDGTIIKENLITDEEGKIETALDKGNYYLKQTSVVDGYNINKGLIQINVENTEPIVIKIESTKPIKEEITNLSKEINVTEEEKNITENNVTEVSNIETININKEIINQINETNLTNVNNYVNTINRRNVLNLIKENTYQNQIEEKFINNQTINNENGALKTTRKNYINYIDMILLDSAKVPILPVASK